MEQRVARETHLLFLTIEEHSALRVSGSGNDGEVMGAKVYRVLVFQQASNGWEFVAHVELEELVGLLLVMSDVVFIVLVQFHLQSVFIVDELIAEVVVEVAVGG